MRRPSRRTAALVLVSFGLLVLALVLALPGSVSPSGETPDSVVAAPALDVDATLLLMGDAGAPNPRGEPALRALAKEAALDPARTTVVFLGDNVYPRGLPAPDAAERESSERRLDAQIAVCASGCRVLFVPGNHDWAEHGRDGWNAVLREEAYIGAHGSSLLPKGALPGPAIVDVASRLRLVLLDTNWWLHRYPRPQAKEEDVVAAIQAAIAGAGARQVAVLAHHPLATGGFHGGRFGVQDHIFPLTRLKWWLWVPLPFAGSAYPLARGAGFSPQDMASAENRKMRNAIARGLFPKMPLVYAAGHEHNLQVLDGPPARHILVSGGGIFGEATRVTRLSAARYAHAASGFMRLDVTTSGRARLGVRIVEESGRSKETYSTWLEE